MSSDADYVFQLEVKITAPSNSRAELIGDYRAAVGASALGKLSWSAGLRSMLERQAPFQAVRRIAIISRITCRPCKEPRC
jgi:hypothetical protein